ncbi:unnamed protein product [Chrysoparadoxa australica]
MLQLQWMRPCMVTSAPSANFRIAPNIFRVDPLQLVNYQFIETPAGLTSFGYGDVSFSDEVNWGGLSMEEQLYDEAELLEIGSSLQKELGRERDSPAIQDDLIKKVRSLSPEQCQGCMKQMELSQCKPFRVTELMKRVQSAALSDAVLKLYFPAVASMDVSASSEGEEDAAFVDALDCMCRELMATATLGQMAASRMREQVMQLGIHNWGHWGGELEASLAEAYFCSAKSLEGSLGWHVTVISCHTCTIGFFLDILCQGFSLLLQIVVTTTASCHNKQRASRWSSCSGPLMLWFPSQCQSSRDS